MNNSKFSFGGLIWAVLGAGSVIGAAKNFMNDKVFACVIFVVLALLFITKAKNSFSQKAAKVDNNDFLSKNPEAAKPVQMILESGTIDTIIDNKELYDSGVKIVSIGQNDKANFVLTGDCLYEDVFKSYDFPARGVNNISYVRGVEWYKTESHMLDEGRMARSGYMAGGLGVAAMNVASAREANANGGAKVNVASGNYFFDMKVRTDTSNVYVLIVNKKYTESVREVFPDCHRKEGTYFDVYYCQLLGYKQCEVAARKMTEELKRIQRT